MEDLEQTNNQLITVFYLINSVFVFFKLFGFTFIDIGLTRPKNSQFRIFQSIITSLSASIGWWFIGYGISNGQDLWGFIGKNDQSPIDSNQDFNINQDWMVYRQFIIIATLIASGCSAERMKLSASVLYAFFQASWIYPVILHWIFQGGFLSQIYGDKNYIDLGILYICGGLCGLISTLILGPRLQRFQIDNQKDFQPNNIIYVVLGTWKLLFSLSFSSIISYKNLNQMQELPKQLINLNLSSSTSAISAVIVNYLFSKYYSEFHCLSVLKLCGGLLSGIIASKITVIDHFPHESIILGITSGIIYCTCSRILVKYQIDDPVDSLSIFLASGIIGLIELPIMIPSQLINTLLTFFSVFFWVCINSILFLYLLKKLDLLIEINDIQISGQNFQYFGGNSQNYDMITMKFLKNIQKQLEMEELQRLRPISSKVLEDRQELEMQQQVDVGVQQ